MGAVLVVLAATVGYVVLGSNAFLPRQVTVTGEQRLTAAVVRKAAHVPQRTPLPRLDTGAIARRIAALPAVAAVDVRRQWPHTVRISVTERVPMLAVPRRGRYALVDASGVAFATVAQRPRRLPLAALGSVLGSIDSASSGSAGAAAAVDPTTKAVLGVVKALSPPLRSAMLRLEADSDSGVTLVLRDGRRVVWGANDRSEYKARVLAALLPRKGRVYDISAPDIVTVAGE